LGDAEIARLASCARQKPCARGETVVVQHDPAGEHLYVVAEGEAAVVVEGADGKESIVSLLKRGDFFGEMSLLDGSPRGATVRTTEASRLIVLRGEDVLRGLRDWPGFAQTLLCEVTRRLRQSNAKVAGLAHQRVERRVALVVLQLFEERGVRLKDESGRRCAILRGRPTQQQIAEMAGTSRETVSRVLTEWEKRKWVRDHVRDLFLFDEDALKHV
jgi:CRP/FNR family transcriptional regulator, cyclic AMP receptor protein